MLQLPCFLADTSKMAMQEVMLLIYGKPKCGLALSFTRRGLRLTRPSGWRMVLPRVNEGSSAGRQTDPGRIGR
jgi:hypothetical protein